MTAAAATAFRRTRVGERDRSSRYAVQASQRGRIIEGAVEAAAEKGAAAITLTDIVSRACVSRTTFYEHFASKEECLVAAIDLATEVLREQIAAALLGAGEPWAKVAAGTEAFCDVVAAEPEFVRVVFAEAYALGPAAVARRDAAVDAFVALIRTVSDEARERDPLLPEVSDVALHLLVEGLAGHARRVLSGKGDPSALLPELIAFTGRALGLTVPSSEELA